MSLTCTTYPLSGGIGTPLRSVIADGFVAADDKDAIDQNNIIGGRTRGAGPRGGYAEPGDEEGLPGPGDGTSSTS